MAKKNIIEKPKRTYRKNEIDFKITVNHKLKESTKAGSFSLYVEMRAKGKVTQMASALSFKTGKDEFAELDKLKSYNLILKAEKQSLESIIMKRINIDGSNFKMGDVINDYRELRRGKSILLEMVEEKITMQFLKKIIQKSRFDECSQPLSMCIFATVPHGENPSTYFLSFEEYENFEGELSDDFYISVPVTNEDAVLDEYRCTISYNGLDEGIEVKNYDYIATFIGIMTEFGVSEFKPLQNIHANISKLAMAINYKTERVDTDFFYGTYNLFDFFCLDDLKNGLVSEVVSVIEPNDSKASKVEILEQVSQLKKYLLDNF